MLNICIFVLGVECTKMAQIEESQDNSISRQVLGGLSSFCLQWPSSTLCPPHLGRPRSRLSLPLASPHSTATPTLTTHPAPHLAALANACRALAHLPSNSCNAVAYKTSACHSWQQSLVFDPDKLPPAGMEAACWCLRAVICLDKG